MLRAWILLLGSLLIGAVAWGCGDKLMLVMGVRASQIKPLHPAAILALPGQSPSAAIIRNMQAQAAFKKAGHRFQVVEDAAGLNQALKSGKYDVVMADMSQASEVSQEVAASSSKPVVLPVAYKPSKEEQSAAQKKYHCLLKAPGNTDNYLAAIDQAMEWKLKGLTR
jgi:ABC-type amino acid transport substrate-binding protein